MSTPEDQIDTGQSPGVLSLLQAPSQSPEGRAWGSQYLKAHPGGVDTSGEQSLLQDFAANAQEAREALRQARDRLMAQAVPSEEETRAQMMAGNMAHDPINSPSGTVGRDLASRVAALQARRQAEQNATLQGAGLQEQMSAADQQVLKARLALQELKERGQLGLMNTALRATAKPEQPQTHPHYSLSEHDVTMPDGTPGKQMFMTDATSGKVVPYGEPTAGGKGAGLDSRSGALLQRVLSSANEAVASINNITELPVGASSGWFGVGASPGSSLFASAKGVLTNKLSSQDVQSYMTMLPGLAKNLAMVESGGLQTATSLNDVFGKLEIREGDKGYTPLHKLAEYRQIVEKGIEPYLHNPRIPPEQKQEIQSMIDDLKASVPFSHNDVTQLERAHATHPEMTMADYIKQQGLAGKQQTASAGAAGAEPAVVKSDEDYNNLPSGALFVGPDGHTRKKP